MPPGLTIREAVLDDAQALTDLVNAAYSGPEAALGWTPETHIHLGPRITLDQMRQVLTDAESAVLAAEREGVLIGTVSIEKAGRNAHLGTLAVSPLLQAGGVGRALMAAAEARALALWRSRRMALTVISLQERLIAYYERRGYRRTGLREPFPHEEQPGALRFDFDLVRMEKALR